MKFKLDPEAFGAYTGIAGSLMLALNNPVLTRIGWPCFLASNFFWIIFAVRGRYIKLFWQQIAFTCASILGIWNAWFAHLNFRALVEHSFF